MLLDERPYPDIHLIAAARTMLSRIADAMGVPVPPVYLSLTVPYAAADGMHVLVNPFWLREQMVTVCGAITCHVALLCGILAHELSHHVHGDIFAPAHHKHAIELRADHDAGVVLARLDVDPTVFAEVIGDLASHHSGGPFGYPSRYERVSAIRRGYESGVLGVLQQHRIGQLAALRAYGLAT